MRNLLLAVLVALVALAAGCTRGPSQGEALAALGGNDSHAATPASPTGASTTTPGSASSSNSSTPSPGANTTDPTSSSPGGASSNPPSTHVSAPPIAWATPEAAKIRPGVEIMTANDPNDATATPGTQRQCTSNFVYTSPDNQSVYLGFAAHCVSGLKLGDPADIGPGIAKGTIAYSSWYVMNNTEVPDQTPAACSSEPDPTICSENDFAMVKLDAATIAITNPAMLHFGGPVGLANASSVQRLDKILTFGNSYLRNGQEPITDKEGYVTEVTPWTTYAQTQFPVLPGDSGSGALTADGHALGIVVTATLVSGDVYNPPETTGITNLDHALAYAHAKGHFDAQLATWALLDPGMLPPLG